MFESSNHRSFQRGLDCDKARASRRDAQLSLRRKNREAHLQKKVRLNGSRGDQQGESVGVGPSISNITKYVANIMQTDKNELQLIGLTAIRKILSVECDPPTFRVLKTGVVPKIVQFMFCSQHNRNNNGDKEVINNIQLESAWIITNIAASTTDCTRAVCQYGAIEGFVDLLRNTDESEIADQALWGLGNIAGDGKELRDRIVKTGVLGILVNSLPNWTREMQKNAIWAMSNIFRYSNRMELQEIHELIPAICKLLRETKEDDIIRDILWCFNYLSNQSDEICNYLVQKGVVKDCMKILSEEVAKYEIALNQLNQRQCKHFGNKNVARNTTKEAMLKMNHNIYQPALRFIGNILSGDDGLTQSVLDAGYLDIIEPFAYHWVSAQRKETIWAISNICAGSHHQIQYVLSRENLLRAIMNAALSDKLAVRREACWCICNAAADAISSQMKHLAEHGAIEALCGMLDTKWSMRDDQIQLIIEGLQAFLKEYSSSGQFGYNPYADQIQECHGLNFLEERMADMNLSQDTYENILKLIETYWGREENNDYLIQTNQQQQISTNIDRNTNQFQFGFEGNNNNQNNSFQF